MCLYFFLLYLKQYFYLTNIDCLRYCLFIVGTVDLIGPWFVCLLPTHTFSAVFCLYACCFLIKSSSSVSHTGNPSFKGSHDLPPAPFCIHMWLFDNLLKKIQHFGSALHNTWYFSGGSRIFFPHIWDIVCFCVCSPFSGKVRCFRSAGCLAVSYAHYAIARIFHKTLGFGQQIRHLSLAFSHM